MKSYLSLAVLVGVMMATGTTGALAHEYACHRVYMNKADTIGFYELSFRSAELVHTKILKERMEAGRLLEVGVLADIKGEPAEGTLIMALVKVQNARLFIAGTRG